MSGFDEPDSDRQLWQRACDGQPEAFGVVFDRHAKAVYNHCFRRTASWSIAEEATSVVFLEAWRRRAEVVLHEESALPWLLGVANRVLSQQWRATRRHRAALARMPAPAAAPDHAEEVASRLDDVRTMRRVAMALSRMPRRDQEVLALCGWAGLDYAAAAIALGVPIGTVRSRLSRARARLSQQLGRDPQPTPDYPMQPTEELT